MNTDIDTLRKQAAEYRRLAEEADRQIASVEIHCRPHNWSETIAEHTHHDSYTIPGDSPGTMGVDRRGPVYVPAETTHRWKRVCLRCGKVEYTSNTIKQVTETPNFGS